jgi:3-oxoadipate enol-lactonase
MEQKPSGIDRGSGKALVFYHAFPLNAEQWIPQIEYFAKDYRVIAWNLAEFFASGGYTAQNYAGMAERFIQALTHAGVERFVQVGCSMGGYFAMSVLQSSPDKIAGTVFANTRAGADAESVRSIRFRQIETVRAEGTAGVVGELLPKLIGQTSAKNDPSIIEKVRALSARMAPEDMMGFLNAMAERADSSEMLAQRTNPACIIAGAEDILIPPEVLMELHSLCASSEYHCIPETGHLSNLETPATFNEIVQRFLENICY